MLYHSTRGQSPPLPFNEIVLRGLASDGGLYVPQQLPKITEQSIIAFAAMNYEDIAAEIILPFTGSAFSPQQLPKILKRSYQNFRSKKKAPLHFFSTNHAILELFHGPTFAFKDFALQFLAEAIANALAEKKTNAYLLGATSGDTGSAAIEACKKIATSCISILHPNNMVSDKQRKQMTTTGNSNVHNFAVTGNFDDCQHIVKALFNDESFRTTLGSKGYHLLAVNSINFGRILAQIVYYFAAFAQYIKFAQQNPKKLNVNTLMQEGIIVSVPTGNFGNVYAAYLAKRMGLPIKKLIVATNTNDILHRFFSNNAYYKKNLSSTFSPSMDIMISSNFERLVFALLSEDSNSTKKFFETFATTGELSLKNEIWQSAATNFFSHAVSDDETLKEMHSFYRMHNYLLDPHTAIAQHALTAYRKKTNDERPAIVVATAHPVKFDKAVEKAKLSDKVVLNELDNLLLLKENYTVTQNHYETVKRHLLSVV